MSLRKLAAILMPLMGVTGAFVFLFFVLGTDEKVNETSDIRQLLTIALAALASFVSGLGSMRLSSSDSLSEIKNFKQAKRKA